MPLKCWPKLPQVYWPVSRNARMDESRANVEGMYMYLGVAPVTEGQWCRGGRGRVRDWRFKVFFTTGNDETQEIMILVKISVP